MDLVWIMKKGNDKEYGFKLRHQSLGSNNMDFFSVIGRSENFACLYVYRYFPLSFLYEISRRSFVK